MPPPKKEKNPLYKSNKDYAYEQWKKSLPENLREESPYYNLRGAWEAGLEPEMFYKDEEGNFRTAHKPHPFNPKYEPHLSSRNPYTGEILKDPRHDTYDMAIEGDIKMGYHPTIDLKTGKMYSISPNDSPTKGPFKNFYANGGSSIEAKKDATLVVGNQPKPSFKENKKNPVKDISEDILPLPGFRDKPEDTELIKLIKERQIKPRGPKQPYELASGAVTPTASPIDAAVVGAAGIPQLVGRGVAGALPYLDAPLTVGSKVLPSVTANNLLNAAGAAYSGEQIINPESDLRTNPNLENILMTGLGLTGLGIGKQLTSIPNKIAQSIKPKFLSRFKQGEIFKLPDANRNQLPPPPSEIEFMPDGTTRSIYQNPPGWEYIDLRRPINGHMPGTPEWNRLNNIINQSKANTYKPKPINKSGFTKEEALSKASAKDKDVISKMSEDEFSNTVLKPTGEIVPYESQADLMPHFTGSNNVFAMSPKEYADAFNERLDLLNDIIAQRNKSGVEYRVKGIDEHGNLTFYTPKQSIRWQDDPFITKTVKGLEDLKNNNPVEFQKRLHAQNITEEDYNRIIDSLKQDKLLAPEGESTWSVVINPGEWRGNVEDIANTQYFRSIPGLEMRNTTGTVFPDGVPRKGTGTYEALNEYLKKLDLGRVKPGFNLQTDFSRGAWENFIKSGRAVGFYNDPGIVYGTMKSIFPYLGAGYLGYEGLQGQEKTSQKQEYKYGGNIPMKLNKYNYGGNMYPNGGNTLYVDNPNDPRLKSYQDSLDAYMYPKFVAGPQKPDYIDSKGRERKANINPNNPIPFNEFRRINDISNYSTNPVDYKIDNMLPIAIRPTFTVKESSYMLPSPFFKKPVRKVELTKLDKMLPINRSIDNNSNNIIDSVLRSTQEVTTPKVFVDEYTNYNNPNIPKGRIKYGKGKTQEFAYGGNMYFPYGGASILTQSNLETGETQAKENTVLDKDKKIEDTKPIVPNDETDKTIKTTNISSPININIPSIKSKPAPTSNYNITNSIVGGTGSLQKSLDTFSNKPTPDIQAPAPSDPLITMDGPAAPPTVTSDQLGLDLELNANTSLSSTAGKTTPPKSSGFSVGQAIGAVQGGINSYNAINAAAKLNQGNTTGIPKSQQIDANVNAVDTTTNSALNLMGPVGGAVSALRGVGDMIGKPIKEEAEARNPDGTLKDPEKAKTSAIIGSFFDPIKALTTRLSYEGGLTDFTGDKYIEAIEGEKKTNYTDPNIVNRSLKLTPESNQARYGGKMFSYGGNIYKNGGKTNSLEGDLISKVIMNRNKDKDFVQRAYAVGEYPESNMFTRFNPNQFGEKNSHLMGYGEDDKGQVYMYPEIMNPNNEAIKVPNQYADYISSEGYKKATGMQYANGGMTMYNMPKGLTHEQHPYGGYPIGNNKFVEELEGVVNKPDGSKYIYSNRLKYNENMTFADQFRKTEKKYQNPDGSLREDKLSKDSMYRELAALEQQQEAVRAQMNLIEPQQMAAWGGPGGYVNQPDNNLLAMGGMIKRADGSYSKRGLWDNIRANKGSGKKPTKQMLEQEKKIKAEYAMGGMMYAMGGEIENAIAPAFFSHGGGIHIDPSKKGTFTAAATKHGKSVQGFASQVLANKENYSPAMVKKANFAKNASKWKHAYGGPMGMYFDGTGDEYNGIPYVTSPGPREEEQFGQEQLGEYKFGQDKIAYLNKTLQQPTPEEFEMPYDQMVKTFSSPYSRDYNGPFVEQPVSKIPITKTNDIKIPQSKEYTEFINPSKLQEKPNIQVGYDFKKRKEPFNYLGLTQLAGPLMDLYYGIKGPDQVNFDRVRAEQINLAPQTQADLIRRAYSTPMYLAKQQGLGQGNYLNTLAAISGKAGENIGKSYLESKLAQEQFNAQAKTGANATNAQIAMQNSIARQQEEDAARSAVTKGAGELGKGIATLSIDPRLESAQSKQNKILKAILVSQYPNMNLDSLLT